MPPHSVRNKALQISLRFKAARISQEKVAKALGVSQSQVSRVLSGQIKRPSKLFDDLCIYAENRLQGVSKDRVCTNEDLIGALAEVWDGTPHHARALAAVIRSLAVLAYSNGR